MILTRVLDLHVFHDIVADDATAIFLRFSPVDGDGVVGHLHGLWSARLRRFVWKAREIMALSFRTC